MAKAPGKAIVHKDILKNELSNGDYVAAASRHSMYICKIIKISPKKIRVAQIHPSLTGRNDGWLVNPWDTVKIDGEDVLAALLK
jgi:hypothetical protein